MQAIEDPSRASRRRFRVTRACSKARNSQLEFLQEELKGVRDLVKEGYAPRNKQLELERMAAEAMGSIADVQANILRARRAIAEMKMRAIQRTQEYRKESMARFSDVRREVQADADKFKGGYPGDGTNRHSCPAEGQVVG